MSTILCAQTLFNLIKVNEETEYIDSSSLTSFAGRDIILSFSTDDFLEEDSTSSFIDYLVLDGNNYIFSGILIHIDYGVDEKNITFDIQTEKDSNLIVVNFNMDINDTNVQINYEMFDSDYDFIDGAQHSATLDSFKFYFPRLYGFTTFYGHYRHYAAYIPPSQKSHKNNICDRRISAQLKN